MARLRHIAVKDLDKAANSTPRCSSSNASPVNSTGSAVYMSDGVRSISRCSILGRPGSVRHLEEGSPFIGAHHFGIQVDDLAETQKDRGGRREILL